ncbi:hypothetical protein Ctob_010914, partial [Chrysochromulina tobinii]
LGSEGISERISVSPGIVLSAETIEQVVGDAAQSCMVPPDYAASGNVSTRWFGTIGSSLAHLNLLHRFDRRRPKCSWLMVLADDVVLLPGFAEWVQRSVFTASNTNVDFVNLAVVRAWGEESGQATSKEASAVKRVSGSQDWPAWTAGRSPADAIVKSPNLLVSGYLVRMATLPVLLKSFGLTRNWRRECSIDQVLARVQYALASSGQYRAVNVEAEWSKLAHCAVGESEKQVIQKRFPDRHAACETQHKELYGSGSRSHDRRRRLSSIDDTLLMTKKKASVKNGHTQPSAPVHVLSAYHVAYSPNAETDDPADLFAETRRCLRDAECTHIMVESAANYYRHLMCLGFRSAMSAWMEGRYFAKGIGVFPSMLMLIRLLDMDLLEVTMLRRPNERTGKRAETYHGTGFVMIVQRRSKLPSEAKPPPRQKIVYLGELYGPKTVRSFFDEVERHMTLKPFVFINKAILLNMNEPTGEGDHLIHGSFFRNELCNRGAIVGAMVQDQTGLDIYIAGDFGLKYTRKRKAD